MARHIEAHAGIPFADLMTADPPPRPRRDDPPA
jgi:hypothetical protein